MSSNVPRKSIEKHGKAWVLGYCKILFFSAGAVLEHIKSMDEVEASIHQGSHILSSCSASQSLSSPPGNN